MSRELDREVAEKVMVWNVREDTLRVPEIGFVADEPELWYEYSPGAWIPLPALSSDISSAWLVVNKLGQPFYLEFSEGEWFCLFGDDLGTGVKAATAPEAICRAALKAVGNGRA